jgi:undecaprenyl diphosphate synthase
MSQVTPPSPLLRHLAIIMDGNRRWARERGLPVAIGHDNGARRLRTLVEACVARSVSYLTVFAFSTENWNRPADEVFSLMSLFLRYLQKEADNMHKMGVRLKVIGALSGFDVRLQRLISTVQAMTAHNSKITLTIAANYGGRWDMLQAVKAWQAANPDMSVDVISEEALRPHLCLGGAPDPDLLIRTGGELRISNFMLWQMAYTELYFTDTLWPDFTTASLDMALACYAQRSRRFGGSLRREAL